MKNVLIVEDEIIIAMDLEKKIEKMGLNVLGIMNTGEEALEKLRKEKADVVFMDIRLGGKMNGITTAIIASRVFMTPVIYATAHADEDTLERAKNANPYAFLKKPFSEDDIRIALKMASQRKSYEKNVDTSFRIQVLDSMMQALYMKNPREQEHSSRVTGLSRQIGLEYQLKEDAMERLMISSDLHDIGKVTIDERILNKEGSLVEEERAEIESHPTRGAIILRTVDSFAVIADIVEAHHERWDGKGYPYGLEKDTIPWESRVIAIADAFDAMTSLRPYQTPVSEVQALEELENEAGKQFDPALVEVFCQMMRKKVKNMA